MIPFGFLWSGMNKLFVFSICLLIALPLRAIVETPLEPRIGSFMGFSDDGLYFVRVILNRKGSGRIEIHSITLSEVPDGQYEFTWSTAGNHLRIHDVKFSGGYDHKLTGVNMVPKGFCYVITFKSGDRQMVAAIYDEGTWQRMVELCRVEPMKAEQPPK